MDFQNRAGGKTGGGGVASWSESNRDRRERLRQLALETIDLNKDPYFMKNHLGILFLFYPFPKLIICFNKFSVLCRNL